MDSIVVNRLEFYGRVGVSQAERDVGQRLVATIEAEYDLRRAGQSDDLRDTISYSELARVVRDVGTTVRCDLLEHLAARMADAILDDFPATAVRIRLVKQPPPTDMTIHSAGVEILRRRDGAI